MTTLAQVQDQEQRLAEVRVQLTVLATEEATLATAIATALAEGRDAKAQHTRRAEVRALRADLAEAATLLETRIAEQREAACIEEARKRLVGIARAAGSLRDELGEDQAKFEAAATAFAEAGSRLNGRFLSLKSLEREAKALGDRFGLSVPDLPRVAPPIRLAATAVRIASSVPLAEFGPVAVGTEKCEHGLRTRRTFGEVRGSAAYDLIQTAGLTPWPPLSERQREIVVERERQAAQDQRTAERARAEIATVFPTGGAMR